MVWFGQPVLNGVLAADLIETVDSISRCPAISITRQGQHVIVDRRRVLDRRTRELVTIGEHVVLGNDRAMTNHMKSDLKAGATREEIIEVCLNSAVYNGFPKAHPGLAVFYKAEQEYIEEAKSK